MKLFREATVLFNINKQATGKVRKRAKNIFTAHDER
jgi:hypothetical protein